MLPQRALAALLQNGPATGYGGAKLADVLIVLGRHRRLFLDDLSERRRLLREGQAAQQ